MRFRPLRARALARYVLLVILATLSYMRPADAELASCPAGQEAVYCYGGGSLAGMSTYWADCVKSKVGTSTTLALGKTSKAEFEAGVAACNGQYTSTWENPIEWPPWNGKRNFKFCHCTANHPYPGLPCFGVQWRSDSSQEASCPSIDTDPYYGNLGADTACRPCTRSLTLTGGGGVEATKVLGGQNARVTGCYGQPEANVPVQITATPLDPANGPAGQLRTAGTTASGTATFNGLTDANGEIRLEFVAPTLAGTHNLSARCSDTGKACTPDPTAPATINVYAALTLTLEAGGRVQPSQVLPNTNFPTQRARVTDSQGQPVSGVAVELRVTVDPTSGYHPHGESVASRPVGEIVPPGSYCLVSLEGPSVWTCDSDEEGSVPFGFIAPEAAGIHEIAAQCVDPSDHCSGGGTAAIFVKIDGIDQIPTSQYYTLTEADGANIGDKPGGSHNGGINHNLTPEATAVLEALAAEYAQAFNPPELPPAPLHVNDASLPWGGVFDIGAKWQPEHHEHRRGSVVDIRANALTGAIPEYRFGLLEAIAGNLQVNGGLNVDAGLHCSRGAMRPCSGDSLRHYHVRLLGVPE